MAANLASVNRVFSPRFVRDWDSTHFYIGAKNQLIGSSTIGPEHYNHKLYEFGVINRYVDDIADMLKTKSYRTAV